MVIPAYSLICSAWKYLFSYILFNFSNLLGKKLTYVWISWLLVKLRFLPFILGLFIFLLYLYLTFLLYKKFCIFIFVFLWISTLYLQNIFLLSCFSLHFWSVEVLYVFYILILCCKYFLLLSFNFAYGVFFHIEFLGFEANLSVFYKFWFCNLFRNRFLYQLMVFVTCLKTNFYINSWKKISCITF